MSCSLSACINTKRSSGKHITCSFGAGDGCIVAGAGGGMFTQPLASYGSVVSILILWVLRLSSHVVRAGQRRPCGSGGHHSRMKGRLGQHSCCVIDEAFGCDALASQPGVSARLGGPTPGFSAATGLPQFWRLGPACDCLGSASFSEWSLISSKYKLHERDKS